MKKSRKKFSFPTIPGDFIWTVFEKMKWGGIYEKHGNISKRKQTKALIMQFFIDAK
jgi:hypothetical protein